MLKKIYQFFAGEQRSLENPAYSLADPKAIEWLGGEMADTGVVVTPWSALGCAAVYQAASLLSGDVAKLPLDLFSKTERGREKALSHPAYNLVRRAFSEEQTAFHGWRQLMVQALLWGNAYGFIDRTFITADAVDNVTPRRIIPMRPDVSEVERHEGRLFVATLVGSERRWIPYEDVLHVRGIQIENGPGFSALAAYRNAVGLALAAEKFGGKFFASSAKATGILEFPGRLSEEGQKRIRNSFDRVYTGVDNAGKTMILEEGMKFHQLTIPPNDGQFIETRQEQVRDIARLFNLPPHKLGDNSRTSFASLEQENQSYLDNSLSPWLHTIAAECWLKLLTTAEQRDGYYFEHNTKSLLRMDATARGGYYRTLREIGVLSVNEIREAENLDTIGEAGDVRIAPLNFTKLESVGEREVKPVAANESARAACVEYLEEQIDRHAKRLAAMKDRAKAEQQLLEGVRSGLSVAYKVIRATGNELGTVDEWCQRVRVAAFGPDISE